MSRPSTFGAYEIGERLGVGALGDVVRAIAIKSRRVVALKRLSSITTDDVEIFEALKAEARLLGGLDHPVIAKVVDVGEVQGTPFIAYEYVHGRDLRAIQERAQRTQTRVPLDVAIDIALRVADALDYAHGQHGPDGRPLGLVHRDVSLPNIIVGFAGDVKLADFGIARVQGSAATARGQVKGTLGYMSPEQAGGERVDARTDVYSLGVCLWELVTGRRLFDAARTLEIVQRIAAGELPSARSVVPHVSDELERVLLKALANSVVHRYPTARAFHVALFELAQGEGLLAGPSRVAQYLRNLFPEVAVDGAASREESLNMADDKGGSDLDVFEGLAKKARPSTGALPALTPPPPPVSAPPRKATLVGGLTPLPPPSGPPMPSKPPMKPASLPPPSLPPKSLGPKSLPPPRPPSPAGPQSSSRAPLPPVSAPPTRPGSLPPPTITPLPPPPASTGAALPPPTSPPKPSAYAKTAPVDMDWDDEEESTNVYDKEGAPVPKNGPRPAAGAPASRVAAGAAALAASSGGSARAQSIPSAPPPPVVPTMMTPVGKRTTGKSAAALDNDEATAVRPRVSPKGGTNRSTLLLALAVGVVVLGLAVFLLIPKKGQFRIVVHTKTGDSLAQVAISINGKEKCSAAPCVVEDLEPGTKSIHVAAAGYKPLDHDEQVDPGKEKVVPLVLEPDSAAPPGPTQPAAAPVVTGLKIAANENQPGVKVSVDGADKGALPLDLSGIAAGSHTLVFEGGERLEKLEQKVDITGGQVKELPSVKLVVLRGKVTIELKTKGAEVSLVRRDDANKRIEKKLKEKLFEKGPLPIDIDPKENWKLLATKRGFDDLVEPLSFDDGKAEKVITIDLADKNAAAAVAAAPAAHGGGDAPAAAEGPGTLSINSIPASNVVLDGRPLGSTPKIGLSVSAGNHTVLFVGPKGRKSVTVTVKPGQKSVASVRF